MDSLELIKTFSEVAQRGSFSKAALHLGVSRANASKYVAELEDRLGVRLLNRTTRSLSLTDAGGLLLKRSEPLLEMVALTRSEIEQHASEPSGQLRISAPYGLAHTELPDLLVRFMRHYPKVRISLDLNNQMVDLVETGVDLALRVSEIEDSSLIVRKLQAIDIVVCATPDYWRHQGVPLHPDDLAGRDALTYVSPGQRPHWNFRVNGKPQAVPVTSRMEASDAVPLIVAALGGLGAVQVPALLVQRHLDSGELQSVLGDFAPEGVWLHAAYVQRRHNSAALKAMLSFLQDNWHIGIPPRR